MLFELTFAPIVNTLLVPLAIKSIVPPSVEIAPLVVMLPVLVTETLPEPFSSMLVIVSVVAVLMREILPVLLFEAVKEVTVFAPPKVVPVTEEVVSKLPLKVPPDSVIEPVVEVKLIALPVVDTTPVIESETTSLSVKAPLEVKVLSTGTVLLNGRLTELPVLPVKMPTLIAVDVFCVIAPVISPDTPKVRVAKLELALILPRATVVALRIVTALLVLFVVVNVPSLN